MVPPRVHNLRTPLRVRTRKKQNLLSLFCDGEISGAAFLEQKEILVGRIALVCDYGLSRVVAVRGSSHD